MEEFVAAVLTKAAFAFAEVLVVRIVRVIVERAFPARPAAASALAG